MLKLPKEAAKYEWHDYRQAVTQIDALEKITSIAGMPFLLVVL